MIDRESPIFIVGCSRSGTTLLRLILAGHSRICIPAETGFLLPLVHSLPLDRPLSSEEADQALHLITGHPRWPDLKLRAETLHGTVAAISHPRLRDIIDAVFGLVSQAAGKPRWGDKTPQYIEIVPQLSELYPGARFIHLIRDGRDVAMSFKRSGFHERWYHGKEYDWTQALRLASQYRSSKLSDQFLEMKYEDLVSDLENNLRRLCQFLGESFEPGMLGWKSTIEQQIPERGLGIHHALRRDPSSDDIGRWSQDLNWMEILAVESFLGSDLTEMGYPLRFAGSAWKPVLWLTRQGLRSARPLLDRFWRLRIGRVL